MTSGDVTVEEHWTAPSGGTMLAVGRTVKKERTLFFEFLRIETRKDGLVYVAQPKGVSPGTDRSGPSPEKDPANPNKRQ